MRSLETTSPVVPMLSALHSHQLTQDPTEAVDVPLAASELVGDVGASPPPNMPVPSVHDEAGCLGSHEHRLQHFIEEPSEPAKKMIADYFDVLAFSRKAAYMTIGRCVWMARCGGRGRAPARTAAQALPAAVEAKAYDRRAGGSDVHPTSHQCVLAVNFSVPGFAPLLPRRPSAVYPPAVPAKIPLRRRARSDQPPIPAQDLESEQGERAAMDSFSSPSLSSSGSSPNPEAVMEQIKAQLAQAYAQEFLETVGNKCFEKCVTKPGSSLSGSESSCISRCVDRYIEATGIVSRALFSSQR
ncbi:mitochondrial import inner membrane translocase subunit Tim13 [Panicum miliaceum]|nr:mitochondrial import inner membrane translocase subunit Tim13 [Panicum miliaceum]